MSFEVYDSFIDSVFVIDSNKHIVYCNEAAATVAEQSVKRLSKKAKLYDVIEFIDSDFFFTKNGEVGKTEKAGYKELNYKVIKSGAEGRLQVCVEPQVFDGETYWVVICHDVTIEETLHKKHHAQLQELENYSKNLEKMVEDRTNELKQANKLMQAMMDSLGQGFLVIGKDGTCKDVYTKSCIEVLERIPSGKSIVDVLNIKNEKKKELELWVETAFQEALPFDSLRELGPRNYEHSEDKIINLEFYPIRSDDDSIQNIVMVATDKTKEIKAQEAMEREQAYSQMIIKLVKNKVQFSQFLKSLEERMQFLLTFVDIEDDKFDVELLFRFLHTIEGEAGIFSVNTVRQDARILQQILEPLKNDWAEDFHAIRSEFSAAAEKMVKNFESYMSDNQSTFSSLGLFGSKKVELSESEIHSFYDKLKNNNASKQLLIGYRNNFIYKSVGEYLMHYKEYIKTASERQRKLAPRVDFVGCHMRVDGDRYKNLFNSLTHAFRNAIDHGLETSDERAQLGKPRQGTITVECSEIELDKKYFQLIVRDDGRGVDPVTLRDKIQSKGFFSGDLGEVDDYEVLQMLFMSGFSSKEEVGELSGRGVGMDAIKADAEALNGEVSFKSTPGRGSTLTILIPSEEQVILNQVA